MHRCLFLFVGLLTLGFGSDIKVANAADHQALMTRVVDDHIMPRLATLKSASQANNQAWIKACASDVVSDAEPLQEAFHDLSDAWMGVDHINFGPVILLFRRDRFYHWPERKNSVGRALARLAKTPIAYDDAEAFAKGSVAIQGLPALERILFAAKPPVDAASSCLLGKAIGANLTTISKNLEQDWIELRKRIAEGKGSAAYFETMTEAASLVLTDLSTGFVKLRDIRIQPMLGKSHDSARPKRGEQWRSGRTSRNINLTLAALQDLSAVFSDSLDADKRKPILAALDGLIDQAKSLPTNLDPGLYEPATWTAYAEVRGQAEGVARTVVSTLSAQYGVRIGFNALDGDG